jgi:hypothetical protein
LLDPLRLILADGQRARGCDNPATMQPRSSEALKTLALALFLAGGLLLVHVGALPFWLWVGLCAVAIFVRLLPRIDPYRDELMVTDQGIVRQHGSRLRRISTEAVRWDELRQVDVVTDAPGAGGKDLLFLLYGEGQNGVAVPRPLAEKYGLLALLQARLPGFRSEPLEAATAAGQPTRITLWERGGPA